MAYEPGALIDSTRILTIHTAVLRGSTTRESKGGPRSALVLRPVLAKDTARVRAFQETSAAFQHLRHTGLLAVEEVTEMAGRPFAVAPLPLGAPLSRLLAGPAGGARRFGLEASARVVLDAARAVQVVHAARPDLRPLGYVSAESVWVTLGGRALLLPSARCAPLKPSLSAGPGAEWSRYRAPECDADTAVDERADVYSLAVILWDLLASGRPRRVSRHRDETGKSPPWIDVSVVRLVMRSLSTDVSVRPQDPGAFAAELSQAVAAFQARAGRSDSKAPSSRPASDVRLAARAVRPPTLPKAAKALATRVCPRADETEDAITIELPALRSAKSEAVGPFEVAAPGVRLATEPAAVQTGTPPSVPGSSKPTPAAPEQRPPRLRVVGEGDPAELSLAEGSKRWVVGRATFVDLVVTDPDMSREHFEILRDGECGYRVHDLGSKNGLFVNGQAATERRLDLGDELYAGATRLRFEA
jgi:hypothetical protein